MVRWIRKGTTPDEDTKKRNRNVCFTVFTLPRDFYTHWQTCDLPEDVRYLVYQLERCPESGREHIQAYVEFTAALRWTTIKQLFDRRSMHIEPRRGTAKQASDYCKKPETRVEGYDFVERGELSNAGRRTDLEAVAERMRAGERLEAVAMDNPTQYIRYHRGLQALSLLYNKPAQRRRPTIRFLWGAPGCGKSYLAHKIWPDAFTMMETKEGWLDGYNQEEEIIFDDFKGIFPYGLMLKLLDYYPLRLPVKGSSVAMKAHTFIFTANEHPNIFYGGEAAWMRRIDNFGTVWDEAQVRENFNKIREAEEREQAAKDAQGEDGGQDDGAEHLRPEDEEEKDE